MTFKTLHGAANTHKPQEKPDGWTPIFIPIVEAGNSKIPKRIICRKSAEQWKKTKGWLGYIGDEKLPSYIGIIINRYKDPY